MLQPRVASGHASLLRMPCTKPEWVPLATIPGRWAWLPANDRHPGTREISGRKSGLRGVLLFCLNRAGCQSRKRGRASCRVGDHEKMHSGSSVAAQALDLQHERLE